MNEIKQWKKNFFTLWGGQAISLLTSAVVQYAFIWYITDTTGSAVALSIATMIAYLPMAFLGPFAGSFVDRNNRKVIMMVADGIIALTTLVAIAIALGGSLPTWVIYFVIFVRSLGQTFHQPCLNAVTPLMVPTDYLSKANGYTNALQSISFILSPAISAALYAIAPFWMILSLDVIGAIVGVASVAITFIPRLYEQEAQPLMMLQDTKAGLQTLMSNKGLFYLVILVSVCQIFMIPIGTFFPLMSTEYFGKTISHAGLVETLFAVGMLVGGLVLGVWGGSKNKMITIYGAVALFSIVTILQGILPTNAFTIFALLSILFGFSGPFFNATFMALMQEKIQPAYLGRVTSVSMSLMTLASPIGLALAALYTSRFGVPSWFVLTGVVSLAIVGLSICLKSVRNLDKQV
ncbi:hypothetical protein A4S06_11080 [Erysipelotrichaceae bacterium MTC7]|nr:hypothetical protein A4S06_11080 [Erysipelotrichaceae bacterium MTC7]